MDLEGKLLPESSLARCCDCGCSCSVMDRSLMSNWIRTVKRKFDEYDEANKLVIPDLYPNVARVAIDNECFALRDMVSRQRETIQDLTNELEKERNASSTAANEALSMILRLQSEKAETQMEFRQFKDYVEKRMAHDQQELLAMEDCLYKRDQVIQSLVENIEEEHQIQYPSQEYPSLKCFSNESRVYNEEPDNEAIDVEKYACGDSLWPSNHLKDLEYRLSQLEKNPVVSHPGQDLSGTNNENEKEKEKESRDFRSFSLDSSSSLLIMGKDLGPDFASDSSKLKTEDCNVKKVDSSSELEDDRSTDIIYMVDEVQNASFVEEYCLPPEKSSYKGDDSDLELKNIYKRLHALEADRESMRQTIVSMRTDKAQLVILKEIAQQLYKDMPPARRMPVKKPSLIQNFSIVSVFKKILCFVFWRKKGRRVKYMFGMSSSNNPGLPTILDKGPLSPHWRCLMSTQV